MTALSLAAGPSRVLELNWPRVTAYSGSFSLHLALALTLLIPPLAMEIRQISEAPPIIVDIVAPPREKLPEPKLPEPPVRARAVPKPLVPRITITEPIPTASPAPQVDSIAPPDANARAVAEAPAAGSGATDDADPSALAYATRSQVPYPIEALRRHEQGEVVLRVLVDADGNPAQIEIDQSSGSHVLDAAARDAVRHWRFKPGMRGGVAYAAWARVPIRFKLPS